MGNRQGSGEMASRMMHRRRLPDGRWQAYDRSGKPIGDPEANFELDAVAKDAEIRASRRKPERATYSRVELWDDTEFSGQKAGPQTDGGVFSVRARGTPDPEAED